MNKTENILGTGIPAARSAAAAGPDLAAGVVAPPTLPRQDASARRYAGFWVRFLAYLIDCFIMTILMTVIFGAAYFALAVYLHEPAGPNQLTLSIGDNQLTLSNGLVILLAFVTGLLGVLYLAIMESTPLQASFGKLALGLKVTDLQGGRISLWRAIGRELAKIISGQTFYIGFIVAGFTEHKQALHDIIARTLVVSTRKD